VNTLHKGDAAAAAATDDDGNLSMNTSNMWYWFGIRFQTL
jgi:hypothetical protein